eukprot:4680970-Amphidinium_carterae.1
MQLSCHVCPLLPKGHFSVAMFWRIPLFAFPYVCVNNSSNDDHCQAPSAHKDNLTAAMAPTVPSELQNSKPNNKEKQKPQLYAAFSSGNKPTSSNILI